MMNTVWEINGQSLELDLDDANDMERYETAFKKMSERSSAMGTKSNVSASERIKETCEIYRNLINDIFGGGTAEKIVSPSCYKLRVHEEMVESFMDFAKTQTDINKARITNFVEKYKPAGRSESK